MKLKKVEEGMIPIYENESKERLINARELHEKLESNTKFADWIKRRIIQYEFVENKYGNKTTKEYYLKIDMAKELCMVKNNEKRKAISD